MLDQLTGSPYFPGGLGEFHCPINSFLVFEDGPSQTITLQWASYYDASDQTSLSRIWGGIHPAADDIPGRIMGQTIGNDAHLRAEQYWNGVAPLRGEFRPFGAGCPGSGGTVTIEGVPSAQPVLGSVFEMRVRNLPLNAPQTLLTIASDSFVPGLDLAPLGAPGCTLDINFWLDVPLSASAGRASWSLPMPTIPAWLGVSLYLQVITPDAPANSLGLTTSNAGDMFIGY